MMVFSGSLDSNVLLRMIINDVPEQHRAVEELFRDAQHPFWVADAAIIEIVFVLARYYHLTRSNIGETIEGLMSLPQLSCNQDLLGKALPIFVKNPALSFEDCCLAAYATLNNAVPLWTFDQKLAKQAPGTKLVARH